MFEENQYDSNIPIYLQIMEKIKRPDRIGGMESGGAHPRRAGAGDSVGVNPNTMQRALSELERDGLLFSERTAGRFITGDSGLIRETRERMADELIQRFLIQMEQLGYSGDEVQERLARRSAPESGEG